MTNDTLPFCKLVERQLSVKVRQGFWDMLLVALPDPFKKIGHMAVKLDRSRQKPGRGRAFSIK
ncbi:MAG: hypothetical protein QM579_09700 [Desulfovibrio sp.]|uniref:hypothetical protein n=1 Tax=Desulfovibrio sp. TaxID=885 RepID=UPI0039E5ACF9